MRPPLTPQPDVIINERTRIKTASARFREGAIHVSVPRHWPKSLKVAVIQELAEKVAKQQAKQQQQDEQAMATLDSQTERVHFDSLEALSSYVHQLNAETLRVPLAKVRIGRSRYSHLAQMNIVNRVMTVSRYCLESVPAEAFRYLILHELAHLIEPSHNKRFWALLAIYVPDYKEQAKCIQRFYRLAVRRAEEQKSKEHALKEQTPIERPLKTAPKQQANKLSPLEHLQQLCLRLFD
ncbi:MAG: M48 family metallopeptidase [Cyanobacteria bacterium]|nr:M48 family metallopeptidase [Cyanobacteriota bacterium]